MSGAMKDRAYLGFRVFRFYGGRLSSLTAVPNVWDSRTFSAKAGCTYAWYHDPREAPYERCSCGLYACAEVDHATMQVWTPAYLLAVVAAWGKIFRREGSFRAEEMEILAIFDPVLTFGYEHPILEEARTLAARAGVEVLPSVEPFRDREYVRAFARERECVPYFDVVEAEKEIDALNEILEAS